MTRPVDPTSEELPRTCLPPWGKADLPEPRPLSWRHWKNYIGPGIVMMGIQIGGGEWLVGPEVTAKYGGGLMWIATISILVQVFYNMECGRYALYCGEPILTGFLRTWPGPKFWVAVFLLLSLGAVIPGLSTQGAAVLAALILDRPAGPEDRGLVMMLAFASFGVVVIPVFIGGKIYNMLQAVMTAKVVVVLGFCLILGLLFVSPAKWWDVCSGFLKFGNVPVSDGQGGEKVVNAVGHYWSAGEWPMIALANIAVLGAFAGYAGGGGLGNSTYSNYVRDKGWGMGSLVGAIPSAVGGKHIQLSHLGTAFPPTEKNLQRWRLWWKYIVTDQVYIWAPGCFVGMALPALLSIQFATHSPIFQQKNSSVPATTASATPGTGRLESTARAQDRTGPATAATVTAKKVDRFEWAQPVIAADGIRHDPRLSAGLARLLWIATCVIGLMVLLPSQMSIAEDISRRWTDAIWSANSRVRTRMQGGQVKYIYYSILVCYIGWCLIALFIFSHYGTPKLMTLIIANLNNLAIGLTAFLVLWVNCRFLPKAIRPRWHHRAGLLACGTFYLGLATLVFFNTQLPLLREVLRNLR